MLIELRSSITAVRFCVSKCVSVYFQTGLQRIEVDEMGDVTWADEVYPEPIPVFGIGLGVLTKAIRMGANFIHDLIISKNCTEIPRSSTLIKINLKQRGKIYRP